MVPIFGIVFIFRIAYRIAFLPNRDWSVRAWAQICQSPWVNWHYEEKMPHLQLQRWSPNHHLGDASRPARWIQVLHRWLPDRWPDAWLQVHYLWLGGICYKTKEKSHVQPTEHLESAHGIWLKTSRAF
jgi:hypothetical protein